MKDLQNYQNYYIYLETYGCSNNQAESEIMSGLLSRSGFQIVKNPDIADVLIINTCIVKKPTEDRMIERIKEMKKYRKKLIIAGCMPTAEYPIIKKIAGSANLIDTHNITAICKVVQKTMSNEKIELIGKRSEERLCLPKIRKNPVINIVPISCGCLSNCSYCIVKNVKGELYSYPEEKIVREISLAHKAGCKEFWLTAQDCSCYGFDRNDGNGFTNLAELLKKITSEVKGKYFIRVGMLNPAHLKKFYNELIDAYDNDKIFKFLHLPVQSGSDDILKAMNRGYCVSDFKKIISSFREKFPNLQLWTDIIIGFPEESDSDFLRSLNLIEEIKPDFVNVSKYGVRPNTIAAKMKQLNPQMIKERSIAISGLVRKLCYEQNKKWINWNGKAIVDEYNHGMGNFIARNFAYKPIAIKNGKIGQIIDIAVVDATGTCLIGHRNL